MEDVTRLIEAFKGIALILGQDGALVSIGPESQWLAELYLGGALPDIAKLAARAQAESGLAVERVAVEIDGEFTALGLTAIPLAAGHCLILGQDRTFDTTLRDALIESRQRYKDLVEVSSDFAFELDEEGRFSFVSQRGALGYTAADFIGRTPMDFSLRGVKGKTDPVRDSFSGAEPGVPRETWMCRAEGVAACLQVTSRPILDDDGQWRGARGLCRDVTLEREKDAALATAYNRERLFNRILMAIRDEVEPQAMLASAVSALTLAISAEGCHIYQRENAASKSAAPDPVVAHGTPPPPGWDLWASPPTPADGVRETHFANWIIVEVATQHRQQVNGAVFLWRGASAGTLSENDRLLMRDVVNSIGIIIEQLANRDHILRLSRTDSLTGLLNRRAFLEEDTPRRIQRLSAAGKTAGLMFIDLDNFKAVNDMRGHHEGDMVLLQLRDSLLEHSRPTDAIARLGGDEFVIWMDGIDLTSGATRASLLLEKVGAALAPLSADADHPLGMSIGLALFDPTTGETPEQCLDRADAAMYAAKRDGKGRMAIAPPADAHHHNEAPA